MNPKYKLVEGEQSIAVIEAGLEELKRVCYPTGMADERIADFIVYQLYRKRSLLYHFYASDLFSNYAVSKYYAQFIGVNKKTGMNYYIDLWLEEGGFSRRKVTEMISSKKVSRLAGMVYMPSEELIKRRFYNTDMGYMLCQNNTTGYSPRSASCVGCKYNKACERATKEKYPELMRLRKKDYENGNKEK